MRILIKPVLVEIYNLLSLYTYRQDCHGKIDNFEGTIEVLTSYYVHDCFLRFSREEIRCAVCLGYLGESIKKGK